MSEADKKPEVEDQKPEEAETKASDQPADAQSQDQSPHEEKIQELTEDLQRVQADFVNFKRRSQKEREGIVDLVKEEVLNHFLPLLDDIERLLEHLPEKDTSYTKGIKQVAKRVDDVLDQLGVEKVEATGQEFDPNLHEAVSMGEGDGENEVVDEVMQTGYKLEERVIRPAKVKVVKAE